MTELSNIHPKILSSLIERLPEGSEILAGMSLDDHYATFMVDWKGKSKQLSMPKVDLTALFAQQSPTIQAERGELLTDVIVRAGEKYNLYLLPRVDFDVNDAVLEFDCSGKKQLGVEILPDSLVASGVFVVTVTDRTLENNPCCKLRPSLDDLRLDLVLSSTIFEATSKVRVADQLARGFCRQVYEHLQKHEHITQVSLEDLGLAKVIFEGHDGVSNLIVVKTLGSRLLTMRYKLPELVV